MLGIVLALLSAIVSALAVVLVARHANGSSSLNLSIIITLSGLILMLPLAALLTDFSGANAVAILLFAASGILTPGLTRLLYYNGLKRLGTSVNSSVFSFNPIYGAFLAVIFLNEILTLGNWLGIGAIISGVIIIQMSCRGNTCANSSLKDWGLPIMAGIAFAVSAILSKTALNLFNAPFLGVTVAYAFAFIPYIAYLIVDKKSRINFIMPKRPTIIWLSGLGLAVAWILSFLALSLTSVNIVVPLRASESLFIAFFSFFYLKQVEKISTTLITGLVIVILGILLVIA
jgi:drug/metabolite transporter, DME family